MRALPAQERTNAYVPGFDSMTIPINVLPWTGGSLSTLVKYTVRDIDNYMGNWKVIALVNGAIEAVSGLAAQDRLGAHEWVVWQGAAADKAEALQCAEKADPRVDLEWMRIRYEKDLNNQ